MIILTADHKFEEYKYSIFASDQGIPPGVVHQRLDTNFGEFKFARNVKNREGELEGWIYYLEQQPRRTIELRVYND